MPGNRDGVPLNFNIAGANCDHINFLPQVGFKPGSLSDSLLEFESGALNRSATTAGFVGKLLLLNF